MHGWDTYTLDGWNMHGVKLHGGGLLLLLKKNTKNHHQYIKPIYIITITTHAHNCTHNGTGWIINNTGGRFSYVIEKINKKQIPIYKNNIILKIPYII